MQNSEPEKKEVIDKEKVIINKEKNKPEVSSGTSTTEKKEGATKKSAETNSGRQLTAERSRSRTPERRPPSPNLPDEVAHTCVGAAVHGLESDSKWGCAVHATEHVGRPDHPVGPRHNLHRRRRCHLKTKEASKRIPASRLRRFTGLRRPSAQTRRVQFHQGDAQCHRETTSVRVEIFCHRHQPSIGRRQTMSPSGTYYLRVHFLLPLQIAASLARAKG